MFYQLALKLFLSYSLVQFFGTFIIAFFVVTAIDHHCEHRRFGALGDKHMREIWNLHLYHIIAYTVSKHAFLKSQSCNMAALESAYALICWKIK